MSSWPLNGKKGGNRKHSKIDTLPVFDFDEEAFAQEIDELNPTARVFKMSATKGLGVEEWAAFLAERIEAARAAKNA